MFSKSKKKKKNSRHKAELQICSLKNTKITKIKVAQKLHSCA